jgi:predicted O-methyltransferase YrrM
MSSNKIAELMKVAQDHMIDHGCSAHPYAYGEKLWKLVETEHPRHILEIGTGIGYSTSIMAMAAPSANIVTLERDMSHADMAGELFAGQNLDDRISTVNGIAEEVLPTIENGFDCIFFDAYGIHYEFLPQYQRLLIPGGLLIVANNHLNSKTSERFFAELQNGEYWNILEKFGDTTVARKK